MCSFCKVTKPTVSIYLSFSYLSCYIEVAIVTGVAVLGVLRNVMCANDSESFHYLFYNIIHKYASCI